MNDTQEALQQHTNSVIQELLANGSDPNALYIIEHHVAHHDFDKLEKIAVDAFKAGYEVSDAEEFEDEETGKTVYCCDIISEIELKAELIEAQQKQLIPLIKKHGGMYDGWGTYFEDPNADDEYGEDGEFFDDEEYDN